MSQIYNDNIKKAKAARYSAKDLKMVTEKSCSLSE